MINAIILDLSHFYSRRRALKFSLSRPGAFLIDCSNNAFSISFSIIELSIASIFRSDIDKVIFDTSNKSGKAYFIKIASFSSIVVAISPFKDFIAGVIEEVLNEVYFRAVQHLFLFL